MLAFVADQLGLKGDLFAFYGRREDTRLAHAQHLQADLGLRTATRDLGRGEGSGMSKVVRLEPSRGRDTHRCASATPPSRPRDTGSSPYKSYPLVSSDSSTPRDLLGGMTGEVEVEIGTPVSRTRSHPTARFLKGPVSLVSLAVAARLPGKALAVYLVTRYRCDLEGGSTVTLPAALLQEFGVDRDAKARALRALEDVGLVQVERTNGRAARITLGETDRGGKG
jgi:hypothetical protein